MNPRKTTMYWQHILIADDDPAIRRLLRASLGACGYKVVTVESSEQALRYTRTRQPDLVILDVLLSGMAGLETCRPPDPSSVRGANSGALGTAR